MFINFNFPDITLGLLREQNISSSLLFFKLIWPESMVIAAENWFHAAWNLPST